jgi:hypothetical protein
MTPEELQLLRENNAMLKYLCQLVKGQDNTAKDFLINLVANLMSEGIVRH